MGCKQVFDCKQTESRLYTNFAELTSGHLHFLVFYRILRMMGIKEQIAPAGVDQQRQSGWSRRDLLKAAGLVAAGLILNNDTSPDSPANIAEFESGFSPLSREEYERERLLYAEMPVPLQRFVPTDQSQLFQGVFTIESGRTTVHKVLTDPNRTGNSLHMLRAVIDGGERQYAIPLVRTRESGVAEIVVGGLSDGKHKVEVYQDPEFPLDEAVTDYTVATPIAHSLFGSIYTHVPIFGLRTDIENPRIDAPIFRILEVQKDQKGDYELTSVEVFADESGGYSADERNARYKRTTDVEWSYKAKLAEGRELVSQERLVNGYNYPLRMKGNIRGSQSLLQIDTNHNTFREGLSYESSFPYGPLLCAMKGIILPPGIATYELLKQHSELEDLSLQEIKARGKMTKRLERLMAEGK